MRVIHSAQFEISIDGVPRTYRDRKELALRSAQILKSRNPNSVIRLKDLKNAHPAHSRRTRRLVCRPVRARDGLVGFG